MEQRIARPIGLTQTMKDSPERGIRILIRDYIASGYRYQGKSLSMPDFAKTTGIDLMEVLKEGGQMAGGQGQILSKSQLHQTIRVLQNHAIFMGLEDRHLTSNQLAILLRSQGDTYKPFVSSEVNKLLATQISTTRTFMDLMKNLAPDWVVREMMAEEGAKEQVYLTVEEALNILAQGSMAIDDVAKSLEAQHHTAQNPLPDISIGYGDNSVPNPGALIQIPEATLDLTNLKETN